MNESVRKLKRLVSELESYVYCDNSKKVLQLADEIITTTEIIKEDLKSTNRNLRLEKISLIPFIYKPVTVKNYYDGDYLERFSEQRTKELKGANILELHDKFWTSNNVERGNIFGSVPTDLVSKDAVTSLLNMGWELSDVIIYEVSEEMELAKLIDLCTKNFKYYIITTEMRNNSKLVLHFNIM